MKVARIGWIMKILLVEDDRETSDHVRRALNTYGHEVEECEEGLNGLAKARTGFYAAIIVDRMLPGMDGLSLVKQLRAERREVPVLFLTTMAGIDDRVEGLEGGGDDYLTKPFALEELVARVHAITKRCEATQLVLRAGDLEMDRVRRQVRRADRPIDLQPQEFNLLEYLLRNPGRIVTRRMLLENVWNLHFDPRTNVVETHMSRLRSKLGHDGAELIQTIRSTGYILHADPKYWNLPNQDLTSQECGGEVGH